MAGIVEPKVSISQEPIVRILTHNFRFMNVDEVRNAFAKRMEEVSDDLGIPPGRGRQTALGERFKVTANAARKWLKGEGFPEMEMAVRIANEAEVNLIWLLQGHGPKRGDKLDSRPGELLDAVGGLPNEDGQQVFDFIRYKFERAEGWFASEKLGKYMEMLDQFEAAMRKNAKKG